MAGAKHFRGGGQLFAAGAFAGNPLAVVALDADLDTGLMFRITRWLNFSETAFLLPPTASGAMIHTPGARNAR